MSCNVCQAKFSFFTKEHACPNCGVSCCSKCLKYKCEVPNLGNAKVCGPCSNKLNPTRKEERRYSYSSPADPLHELYEAPIEFTYGALKTLATLENPARPPIVMYENKPSHWDKFKEGLEPADQSLVDRLQKLKGEDKNIPPPTVEEIKERLAILKDQDIAAAPVTTADINHVDTRTDQEQADSLLQEYLSQLQLSSSTDPCKNIQDKLNAFRGTAGDTASAAQPAHVIDIDTDEDAVTHKLLGAALAETQLSSAIANGNIDVDVATDAVVGEIPDVEGIIPEVGDMGLNDVNATDMDHEGMHGSDDDDDKPSCVMCDQTTGLMHCMGCTGDLYCSLCFEDNHDEFELGKHKRVPYNPAKVPSPD